MKSQICTYSALNSAPYQEWALLFGNANHMHRKIWEWCFICEALKIYGFLTPGKTGLGFAVGQEPLVSVFTAYGATVLATDLDTQAAAGKGWVETAQHADNKAQLNQRGLCSRAEFERLASFEFSDMTDIPDSYADRFDFTWSACAFEHLGSLDAGMDFVLNSMKTLRPGGLAVHTTEFNVSSEEATVDFGETVIYRRKDIEKLISLLKREGYGIEMDWSYGKMPLDYFVDIPPYSHNPHLKLRLCGYTVTSVGLIIKNHN
jgi:SAM-dependent methyltransferase